MTTQPNTPEELTIIASLLAAFELHRLVGRQETELLEAKGNQPYDLSTQVGRCELAKDVSAFANADGGYLLVGLTTRPVPDESTDEISALDLLPEAEFATRQYLGIIDEYVYPRVQGITCQWIHGADAALGVGSIYVPPQPAGRKLFVVSRTALAGEVLRENVVGIFHRVGAQNIPYTAEQVYRALRDGNDPQLRRLMRVEEKVDAVMAGVIALQDRTAAAAAAQSAEEQLAQQLKTLRARIEHGRRTRGG